MPNSQGPESPEYYGRMIPVHVEIDAAHVVLGQPEMRELLASADVIAVGAPR
jgi:hypothetical protein